MAAFLNKERHKWSNKMKNFCAQLYYKSPTAYSFIAKTFSLPSKKTVLRFAERGPNTPERDPNSPERDPNTSERDPNTPERDPNESDPETNDDLFSQSIIVDNNTESLEAVNQITPNIDNSHDDDHIDQTIHDDDQHDLTSDKSKFERLTTQITVVPTFSSAMKTYARPKI